MAKPGSKIEKFLPRDSEGHSVGEVVKEIGTSAMDLVKSEIDLARAEFKESATYIGRHSAQAAMFGALLAISVFPFLAFCVIGLGNVLDGRYWLSSLIVAIVCAVVGGAMAYRAYNKMKKADLSLPRTRETLQQEKEMVVDKTQDIKQSATDGVRDVRDSAQRRAS
ncbi:MAG: phage holin family protein [Bdellovibrionia bacterium]